MANETYKNDDFEYHIEDGHVVIDRYVGNEKDVTIPSEIDGKSVTKIGDDAFGYCESLTSIVIPDSVTEIGNSAFAHCESLTEITIPGSVTKIGKRTFSNCTNLELIIIPDSVKEIGEGAFAGCESLTDLTEITIPDSIKKISKSAFAFCTGFTSIAIPDSVTEIGDSAFEFCESLVSIDIPDSVTIIGDDAFFGCNDLKEITLPEAFANKSRDELEQMRIYPDKVEVKIRGKNGEISAYKDPTQKAKLAEAPESKTIEESKTDYWRTVASKHKEDIYKNVIDAIPELAMESGMITKEGVISEPEQSSQSKETIVSKLKEFYTLTMTRLNAVFDPEIRDFSKQIKRFSEMSESGEIKSDPYGDLSDVQREQVDGIVRILSDHINGLGFSKDGRSVPNDEKIREFVAIAAGTYSYYADEKFSMNDAIESVAQAINKEFKDDEVLSSMRVSREGIELAKAFAAEVSGIQDVTEVKKTAKEFFRQNLSDTGYGAFNMESPERPTSLIKQNGRINIKIDPRNLTATHSPETLSPETPTADVKTERFSPHHRTV